MSIFASETPTYSYDPRGDTLYIEYSREQAERTVEILNGWPMLLVDLNAEEKITGIVFVDEVSRRRARFLSLQCSDLNVAQLLWSESARVVHCEAIAAGYSRDAAFANEILNGQLRPRNVLMFL